MSDSEAVATEQKKGRGRPPKSKQAPSKKDADKEDAPPAAKRGRPMRKAAEEANKKTVEKKEDVDEEEKPKKRGRGRPAGSTKGKKAKAVSKGGKRGRPAKSAVNNSAKKDNEANEASPEEEEEEEDDAVSSGEEKTE